MQDGGLGPAREEKRSLLIPEHKIEEVLERCDIVALISRHVELKKSGRSYKGRCPFHEEKTASFHVTPEMRRFKCFGCQVGGDAIAFVQRYFGKTFVDAVKDLARETGVELQAFEDPIFKERRQLREVTEKAAEHFKVGVFIWTRRGCSVWAGRRWRGAISPTLSPRRACSSGPSQRGWSRSEPKGMDTTIRFEAG